MMRMDQLRFVDAYDTKTDCLAAATTMVAVNAERYAHTKRLAWRCLPQGLHPSAAQEEVAP
jgi:hypothetical protein